MQEENSKMLKRVLLVCVAGLVLTAPLLAYPRHFVVVSPGLGWGWYDPFWGPYPYAYGYPEPATGQVKFDTKAKDTQVFIDGAYAGTVGKLKKLNLRPGAYNIELRAPNQPKYAERIYVIAGKTLHLNPNAETPSQQ